MQFLYVFYFQNKQTSMLIGAVSLNPKTRWEYLDSIVNKFFQEYVLRIDSLNNLGLTSESILCYQIGEIVRGSGMFHCFDTSYEIDLN